MIDTIKIKVNYTKQGASRIVLEDKLQKPEWRIDKESGRLKSTVGEYGKQWYCSITENHLEITGSLPKEIFGTNFRNASQLESISHFYDMGEEFGLRMQDAKVMRLDIANNMIVSEPPIRFYPYLGTPPLFKRFEQSTTLTLKNPTERKIQLFYDKAVWAQDKRQDIPFDYQGAQTLRFETRKTANTSVGRMLNIKEPTLKDILKDQNWELLLEDWKQSYFTIPKQNNVNFMIEHFKNQKQRVTPVMAERALLISLISHYGEEAVPHFADLLKAFKMWGDDQQGRNNKYRFLNGIKSDLERYRTANDYIDELDSKIKSIEVQ